MALTQNQIDFLRSLDRNQGVRLYDKIRRQLAKGDHFGCDWHTAKITAPHRTAVLRFIGVQTQIIAA